MENIKLEKFIEAIYDHMRGRISPKLRRTFGNRHWRVGTPLETIAEMMGHESVNQTFKAYIGVQLGDMQMTQSRLLHLVPSRESQ